MVSAAGQEQVVDIGAIAGVTEALEESPDFKLLKKTKWIVTEVERDGDAIPAQFGQKEGDIITLTRQGNAFLFG